MKIDLLLSHKNAIWSFVIETILLIGSTVYVEDSTSMIASIDNCNYLKSTLTRTNYPITVPTANPSAPTLHMELVFLLIQSEVNKINYYVSSSFFNQTIYPV